MHEREDLGESAMLVASHGNYRSMIKTRTQLEDECGAYTIVSRFREASQQEL